MSETTPVGIVFDLHRQAIEGTHQAVRRSVETQQTVGEALFDFGPARQAHERSYEAVRTAVDGYFDAVGSTLPDQQDQLQEYRDTVDEQLDTLEATQSQAIDSLASDVGDGSEAVDDQIEEFIAVLDEQFEAVLEAHEGIEDRTAETFDSVEGNLEDLKAEFEAHKDLTAETFGAPIEQFETQIAEIQQQIEELTADITERAGQQVADQSDATSESLEAISGLGPAYAERLQDHGIESMKALADATAEGVAEAADVSVTQAESWIDAASSWA